MLPRSATAAWKFHCQPHSPSVAAWCRPAQPSPRAHLGKASLRGPFLFPRLPAPYPNPDSVGGRKQKEPGTLASHLCSFCNFILFVYLLPISSLSPGRNLSLYVAPLAVNSKKTGLCLVHQCSPYMLTHLISVCAMGR